MSIFLSRQNELRNERSISKVNLPSFLTSDLGLVAMD